MKSENVEEKLRELATSLDGETGVGTTLNVESKSEAPPQQAEKR